MRRWKLALEFCRYAESAFAREEYLSASMNALAAIEQAIMAMAEIRGEEIPSSHRSRMYYLTRLANEGIVSRDLLRMYSTVMEIRNDAEYEGIDGERARRAIVLMCRFLEVIAGVLGVKISGCC